MRLSRKRLGHSKSMKSAAIVQFASKYTSIGVQLIVTAVLARLVTPDEFGLIAIVNVFTAFFVMFTDMGLGIAIVQFRNLKERDFGALFSFSIVLGLVLSIAFCAFSVPVSWFYGHSVLVALCCAAAPSLLFSCMNMVPNGLLLREKRFAGIGLRLVASNVVSGSIAIVMAFSGWGAYALIAQSVLSSIFVLAWNILARPVHEINLHFGGVIRKVFSYSVNQFGFSFLNYFSRNLDNLVIGRALGSQPLAFYDKAYKLTTYPMTSLSSVIASVIQPFMAEHQDEPDVLRDCWWKVASLLSLVGAPIAVVFMSCSEELTLLFYGDQWGQAIPLLQVLSISLYFQIIGNPGGAFYQSAGRTDKMFQAGLINTALTVVGLFVGLGLGGLAGAACGISLAYCFHVVVMYFFLIKGILGIRAKALLAFVPEISAAIVACILCMAIAPLLGGVPLVVSGAVKLALIVAVMFVAYVMTGRMDKLKVLLGRK